MCGDCWYARCDQDHRLAHQITLVGPELGCEAVNPVPASLRGQRVTSPRTTRKVAFSGQAQPQAFNI